LVFKYVSLSNPIAIAAAEITELDSFSGKSDRADALPFAFSD